jgi:hypothetical protein
MQVGDEIALAILSVALLTLVGTALSIWLAVQAVAEQRTRRLEATVLRVRQASEDHIRLAERQLLASWAGAGRAPEYEKEAELELAYQRFKSSQNATGPGFRAQFHRHVSPKGSRLAERSLAALAGDRPWSAAQAADEILEVMWASRHGDARPPRPWRLPRRRPFQPVGPVRPQSGFFVETGYGRAAGFELVCPTGDGGLEHWRRSGAGDRETWLRVPVREPGLGEVSDASLLVSNLGRWGNREVLVRAGDDLLHFWSEGVGDVGGRSVATWREARDHSLLRALGPEAEAVAVAGAPAFIQGIYGGRGNLEVLVPRREAAGLVHLWRESDTFEQRWRTGTPFVIGDELGTVAAVALIHSRAQIGARGTLELVARAGERLFHYRRSPFPIWDWHRVAPDDSLVGEAAAGVPSLVQGPPTDDDAIGPLHLAAPHAEGGIVCLR